MKRFIIVALIIFIASSLFAGRASESARKADNEAMSFREWRAMHDEDRRAHESAERKE